MINYKKEHLNCINYKTDDSYGFKHLTVTAGGKIELDKKVHHLVFVIDGAISFNSMEVAFRKVSAKEVVLIPKNYVFSYEVLQDSDIMIFSFSILRSVCDKLFIHQSLYDNGSVEPLLPVPINPIVENFLSTMGFYLSEGLNCEHLHELKEKELFLLFRAFYSKKELSKLFHEILGESDFRSLIMHNYLKVNSVGELASLANMGRTTFDCKFKTVFGTSARQWMLAQIAKHVKAKAMDPDVTISDLMEEYNFNSATHFNWFCKKQFKCTPLELIRSCRRSELRRKKNHGKVRKTDNFAVN